MELAEDWNDRMVNPITGWFIGRTNQTRHDRKELYKSKHGHYPKEIYWDDETLKK